MSENSLIYLGNRIRNRRKECRLTQQELADQTGLAVKTVQDIEAGRINPTYETLELLIIPYYEPVFPILSQVQFDYVQRQMNVMHEDVKKLLLHIQKGRST